MKNNFKLSSAFRYFLASVLLSSAGVIAIKHYIEFLELTSGTYNIAMLFNRPLRDFLLIVLLFVAGLLTFITFAVKFSKAKQSTQIYQYYLIGMGALWIILPQLSAYNISRITGSLIIQTVSGIAIIANVVFMMVSVCCGLIAVIDCFSLSKNDSDRDYSSLFLAGVPTGYALTELVLMLLKSQLGLGGIFAALGAVIFVFGIICSILRKR